MKDGGRKIHDQNFIRAEMLNLFFFFFSIFSFLSHFKFFLSHFFCVIDPSLRELFALSKKNK